MRGREITLYEHNDLIRKELRRRNRHCRNGRTVNLVHRLKAQNATVPLCDPYVLDFSQTLTR